MSLSGETTCGEHGRPLTRSVPPLPFGFLPVSDDEVIAAVWLKPGEHPVTRRRPRGNTEARKNGLRYEKKLKAALELRYMGEAARVYSGQWIAYQRAGEAGAFSYCQPDIVIVEPTVVTIVEAKLSFTTDAWWQLVHRYGPVVRRIYGATRSVRLANVVRNYEPSLRFPDYEEWALRLGLAFDAPKAIHVWKGKK